MEISHLEHVARLIAPEVDGRISLHLAQESWPFPPSAAAIFAQPPPWIPSEGRPVIVFRPEHANHDYLVHELAHALPIPETPIQPSPIEASMLFASLHFDAWSSDEDSFEQSQIWHDRQFIRRAVHLAVRGWLNDRPVNLDAVLGVCGCPVLPAVAYRRALGDEPRRCLKMNFREIENLEPPPAFLECFEEAAAANFGREFAEPRLSSGPGFVQSNFR